MKCSDWENVVSWTHPSVLLCKPYQRFGPDSVFITFLSLFILGFNASDFVKFSSCSASGEIDQTHNISQHPCESAIDSIVCDNDNALICRGNCGVIFELQNPETIGKIIIQNGVRSQMNQIKAFKLKVKKENEETLQCTLQANARGTNHSKDTRAQKTDTEYRFCTGDPRSRVLRLDPS